MSCILVIEDDLAILRGLTVNLKFESYDVLTATDGETGYDLLRTKQPDLVVLDLMIPKLNGYELCRRARADGITTPILMLTARSEEMDRVQGLDLGADDYVTKPFSIPELMARVRALLRRSGVSEDLPSILRFGDVEVDFQRYEARKSGKLIRMARKEYEILQYLASRMGQVVTREELLTDVWSYDAFPTTRTVDNHIASIRAKFEADTSAPCYLLTVHGVGYRLVGDR